MPDRRLYAVEIPEDALQTRPSNPTRRLASAGAVSSDVPAVQGVSTNPKQQRLTGEMVGALVQLSASELEQLFSADLGPLPYFAIGDATASDAGYYETSQARDIGPRDARDDRVQGFDGNLEFVGTRQSHWRALHVNPTDNDNNPFGSGSAGEVGINHRARKARWFDTAQDSQAIESATVQRTVETERDAVDIYDATEPSFSPAALIFDLPYRHDYRTDVRVWDERGADKYRVETADGDTVGSAEVGSATVGVSRQATQWQQAFLSTHDFEGLPTVENGRLRLVFDEQNELRAYRWSPSEGTYGIVQLGNSPWRLWDADLLDVGLASVELQLEFEDTSAASLTTHNLNCAVIRGRDDALFLNPTNEGSVPSGLVTRLDAIATTQETAPEPQMDLIKRSEVNR